VTQADPLAERRAARAAREEASRSPHDPVLPGVRQNVVGPREPVTGRIATTRICTASRKAAGFVRHIEIDVSGTSLAGSFRAGQSFGVLPPGEDERGRAHKPRLYSLASPTAGEDGRGSVVATTVKRLLEEHEDDHTLFRGVASNHLCDLSEGDEVMLHGPAGKSFVLPEDPSKHDYVFFATGTGIAPFRGMLGDLVAAASAGNGGSRATLVMGAPYASDLLYHDELTALQAEHDWFTYLPTISRHGAVPGRHEDVWGPAYVDGRLNPDAPGVDGLIDALRGTRTLVYICGIAGMELGVLRALRDRLDNDTFEMYAAVDDEAGDPGLWTRRMIRRAIRPSRRVMLEVY